MSNVLTINASDYTPHQFEFLVDESKILGLVCGFGAGKTHVFLRKTLLNHIFRKNTNEATSNGWIIYPTLDLANELFVEPFKELLDSINISFDWNVQKNRFKTKYGNIRIYTLEQPDRMVGANLTYAGIDEFDTVKMSKALQCFKKIIGRLRGCDRPQLYIVTTPEGFKATYHIFVENKKDGQKIIQARTIDNPYLPEGYIDMLRQQYDETLLKAYLDGQFVNLTSGQVYYSFDRAKHLLKTIETYDPKFPVAICFDFNVYPYSVVWGQKLNDLNIRFLGEWVSKSHSNTYEACDEIMKRLPNDVDVVVYGDASGRSGAANSNLTNYQIINNKFTNYFKSVSFKVPSSNPSVRDRVNCVNSALHRDIIRINPECDNLIQDLEQVTWNEKGNELDKSNIKRTHISDAMGYFINLEVPLIDTRNQHKSRIL